MRTVAASAFATPLLFTGAAPAITPDPWALANRIAAHVRGPKFPHRRFGIRSYGAVGDGVTDCTAAIRTAIRACHQAGGDHVDVPEGRFRTGAVHLLSNVDLHVTAGATLLFSTDPKAYLPLVPTRFEGPGHGFNPRTSSSKRHRQRCSRHNLTPALVTA